MDYYGLLFLYYLKGLSGKSILRLFFNIEVGGTEQLLPENTSTPTTTPILADIQYPDGLRTDQYFTYRETPTTVSNKARIKTIKGNTLVWNQLLESLASTKEWGGITITNNGDGSLTLDGTYTGESTGNLYINPTNMSMLSTHWYLYDFSNSALNGFVIRISSAVGTGTLQGHGATINHPNADTNDRLVLRIPVGTIFNNVKVYPQIYDLTLMFGAEIAQQMRDMEVAQAGSGVAYFRSLFPLSFYDYNAGTLLSFNGTGIKTVGKNFVNVDFELLKVRNTLGTWNGNEYTYQGVTFKVNFTSQGYIDSVVVNGTATANANLNLMRLLRPSTFFNKPITMSGCPSGGSSTTYRMTLQMQTSPYTTVGHDYGNGLNATIPDNGEDYQAIIRIISGYTCNNVVFRPMITFQGADQTFEPYTTSTTSLPISTYFPDGMQGHGDTYDELTSAVATKRFEKDNLGDLTWTRRTTNIFSANLPSEFDASKDISCFMSNRLPTVFVSGYTLAEDGYISIYKTTTVTSSTSIYLNMASQSIDTVADLQTWLSNNPTELVYPLATPTETPITTEDANEALSLLMGKSVSSNNANQLINIITKGE